MPTILKPDMKALVWLGLGLFVAPRILSMARGGLSSVKSTTTKAA